MTLREVHVVCCLLLPGTVEVLLERNGGGGRGIVKQLFWLELHCPASEKRPADRRLSQENVRLNRPSFIPHERLSNGARQPNSMYCLI